MPRVTIYGNIVWKEFYVQRDMLPTKVEDVYLQLAAFYPEYTPKGNMTRLICVDNQLGKESCSHDQRQVENVKLALARCYAVDLHAQVQILRAKYSRRNLFHFYLPDGRVFVPFKLRQSRIRGDARYGYVDLNQIARILPGDPPAVRLHSGSSLPLYSDINSARLAYFLGMEILTDFGNPHKDSDLDLLNALSVMRGFLNGQTNSPTPSLRLRTSIKFLPRD